MKLNEETLKFLQMNQSGVHEHAGWVTVGSPLRRKTEREPEVPELTKEELEAEKVRQVEVRRDYAVKMVNALLPDYDNMPFGAGR